LFKKIRRERKILRRSCHKLKFKTPGKVWVHNPT